MTDVAKALEEAHGINVFAEAGLKPIGSDPTTQTIDPTYTNASDAELVYPSAKFENAEPNGNENN